MKNKFKKGDSVKRGSDVGVVSDCVGEWYYYVQFSGKKIHELVHYTKLKSAVQ